MNRLNQIIDQYKTDQENSRNGKSDLKCDLHHFSHSHPSITFQDQILDFSTSIHQSSPLIQSSSLRCNILFRINQRSYPTPPYMPGPLYNLRLFYPITLLHTVYRTVLAFGMSYFDPFNHLDHNYSNDSGQLSHSLSQEFQYYDEPQQNSPASRSRPRSRTGGNTRPRATSAPRTGPKSGRPNTHFNPGQARGKDGKWISSSQARTHEQHRANPQYQPLNLNTEPSNPYQPQHGRYYQPPSALNRETYGPRGQFSSHDSSANQPVPRSYTPYPSSPHTWSNAQTFDNRWQQAFHHNNDQAAAEFETTNSEHQVYGDHHGSQSNPATSDRPRGAQRHGQFAPAMNPRSMDPMVTSPEPYFNQRSSESAHFSIDRGHNTTTTVSHNTQHSNLQAAGPAPISGIPPVAAATASPGATHRTSNIGSRNDSNPPRPNTDHTESAHNTDSATAAMSSHAPALIGPQPDQTTQSTTALSVPSDNTHGQSSARQTTPPNPSAPTATTLQTASPSRIVEHAIESLAKHKQQFLADLNQATAEYNRDRDQWKLTFDSHIRTFEHQQKEIDELKREANGLRQEIANLTQANASLRTGTQQQQQNQSGRHDDRQRPRPVPYFGRGPAPADNTAYYWHESCDDLEVGSYPETVNGYYGEPDGPCRFVVTEARPEQRADFTFITVTDPRPPHRPLRIMYNTTMTWSLATIGVRFPSRHEYALATDHWYNSVSPQGYTLHIPSQYTNPQLLQRLQHEQPRQQEWQAEYSSRRFQEQPERANKSHRPDDSNQQQSHGKT